MSQFLLGDPDAVDGKHGTSRLDKAGGVGFYLFVLFFQLNATVAYVGLLVTLFAFVLQTRLWATRMAREPVFYLFWGIVFYMLAHAAWATHEFSGTGNEQWENLRNWLHALLFIPVAWHIKGDLRTVNRLMAAVAVGVMTRILTHLDWGNLLGLFAGTRTGFGLNPIALGLYSGVATLGLLLLAPKITKFAERVPKNSKMVRFFLWLVALLIFLEAFILSQSRGSWLAAAMVFPIVLTSRYWGWLRNHAFKSSKGLALLTALLVASGAFVVQNASFIENRVKEDPETVRKVLAGDLENSPTSSISYRLLLWRVGLQKWSERPLFGWGPGTTGFLIAQAGDSKLARQNGHAMFSHLHNLYLEVLVQFGLFGALLFAALSVLLLQGLWKAYRCGRISRDYLCFFWGIWGFTAIWSFFDFRLFHYEWRNFCVILAALPYSFQLQYAGRDSGPKALAESNLGHPEGFG